MLTFIDTKIPCMMSLMFLADLQGKRVAISGSGNVAIYAAYKCIELGAKVITLSDSGGYHIVEEGMTKEMVDAIDDIKVVKKGRLSEYNNDKGEPCRLYSLPPPPPPPPPSLLSLLRHLGSPCSRALAQLAFGCKFCFSGCCITSSGCWHLWCFLNMLSVGTS